MWKQRSYLSFEFFFAHTSELFTAPCGWFRGLLLWGFLGAILVVSPSIVLSIVRLQYQNYYNLHYCEAEILKRLQSSLLWGWDIKIITIFIIVRLRYQNYYKLHYCEAAISKLLQSSLLWGWDIKIITIFIIVRLIKIITIFIIVRLRYQNYYNLHYCEAVISKLLWVCNIKIIAIFIIVRLSYQNYYNLHYCEAAISKLLQSPYYNLHFMLIKDFIDFVRSVDFCTWLTIYPPSPWKGYTLF
jgi:hypothetical protein